MKVLISEHITFNQDSTGDEFASICGSWRIEDMTMEDFCKWADKTNSDYITEEYGGEIYFPQKWDDLCKLGRGRNEL